MSCGFTALCRSSGLCLALSLLSVGCGGGAALMHPAHPLAKNEFSMGAGVSNNFVLGNARDDIDAGREANAVQGAAALPSGTQDFVAAAIVDSSLAPGLAPWVGARVGLGYDSDAGLTYTGRGARVDGRHAFLFGETALSIGLGASGVLKHTSSDSGAVSSDTDIPGLDNNDLTGFGFDVPVLYGWQSDAQLIALFVGARAGYERVFGDIRVRVDADPTIEYHLPLRAERLWFGGLLGFAVGVRPVWVVFELDVAYQRIQGEVDWGGGPATSSTMNPGSGLGPVETRSAETDGIGVVPTGAIVARF